MANRKRRPGENQGRRHLDTPPGWEYPYLIAEITKWFGVNGFETQTRAVGWVVMGTVWA